MQRPLRQTLSLVLILLPLASIAASAQLASAAQDTIDVPVVASGGGELGGGGTEVLATIGQPFGPEELLTGVDDETIWIGFWAVVPSDPSSVREERLAASTGAIRIASVAPNPFTDRVVIDVELARAARLVLAVHDGLGGEVVRLVDGEREPGGHRIEWRPEDLPSGAYIIRLEVDGVTRGSHPVQHYQ